MTLSIVLAVVGGTLALVGLGAVLTYWPMSLKMQIATLRLKKLESELKKVQEEADGIAEAGKEMIDAEREIDEARSAPSDLAELRVLLGGKSDPGELAAEGDPSDVGPGRPLDPPSAEVDRREP